MQGIIDWAKTRKQTQYDCIVTVSGGKDSTRQAMFARDNLKLNPLLVSVMYTQSMDIIEDQKFIKSYHIRI